MTNENASKKSLSDQKDSETKDAKEVKPKKRTKKCCCAMLLALMVIIIVAMIIRSCTRNSADVDISKFLPTPSGLSTPLPSNKPVSTAPENTNPEDAQPAAPEPENTPEPANNTPDAGISKQEQIDYFVKVAIRDSDHDNIEVPLRKWGKNNVSIQVTGPVSPMSDQCINDTISAINSLANTLNLSRTDGAGDIELNMTDRATLEARGFTVGGFYVFDSRAGSSYNITGATAYAATDYWPGEDLLNCQIIRHELTHTIGLPFNTSGILSIFGPPTTTTNEYQEIDKQLIKMLYNTGITSGLGEAEVRAFFAGTSW